MRCAVAEPKLAAIIADRIARRVATKPIAAADMWNARQKLIRRRSNDANQRRV